MKPLGPVALIVLIVAAIVAFIDHRNVDAELFAIAAAVMWGKP